MKTIQHYFLFLFTEVMLIIFLTNGNLTAQEVEQPISVEDPLDVEIPFIDRDSDGINDLMQNGWGLRFMNRYRMRQGLWDQLNVEVIQGEDGRTVDTDGDGVGDIPFRDFMREKMAELIDTDGDGVKDTPMHEYLGRRFRSFDSDGDGLPDDMSREEMREQIKEMRAWRQEIRERIIQGLPAFVDEDEDGVPDNIPGGPGWRGFRNRGGNN